jgi:SAM-dependent methyltransferase
MAVPLESALAEIRAALLDPELRRAVAAGRRRGAQPRWVRAELRPVRLKAGDRLQLVTSDGQRPTTSNAEPGVPAEKLVDELLAEPFGNWHVETATQTLQLRVTKKGEAQLHRATTVAPQEIQPTGNDREKQHLLAPDDPLFAVIGGNAAKRRQVDAFLRALAATVPVSPGTRLDVVDLGCGNAYLTFAAYRYLAAQGVQVRMTGVDVREDQRRRNSALADELGCADDVHFVAGTIADAPVASADVVLALHACDTATDDALARAVGWQARYVLAAPCCHHDIAAQLRGVPGDGSLAGLTRQPILRERFADVLTDSLRAALLRMAGYRVEVVEFIDSAHTPRNLLLRATRTGTAPTDANRAEYAALVEQWQVTPKLAELLQVPLDLGR